MPKRISLQYKYKYNANMNNVQRPKISRCISYTVVDLVKLPLFHHHHHNRFTTLFPGPPGWAGARRELLDFMVQGKINRGRHNDHLAGRHSIRTNQCPRPPSPIFFSGRMPFLPPKQQCQSTEGNAKLWQWSPIKSYSSRWVITA